MRKNDSKDIYLALLVSSLLIFVISPAVEATSACSICPSGQFIVHPDALIRDGKRTCAAIDYSARHGQYGPNKCAFLQGFAKDTCCGYGSPAVPSDAQPNPSVYPNDDTRQCYEATDDLHGHHASIGQFCVESTGVLGICFAKLQGELCTGCRAYESPFQPFCPNFAKQDYQLDCSNIDPEYKQMQVCGNSFFLGEPHSKKNPHKSGGGDDDDDFLGSILVSFFIFLGCVMIKAVQRRESRQYNRHRRGQLHRYERTASGVELSAVAVPVGTIPISPQDFPDQNNSSGGGDDIPLVHAQSIPTGTTSAAISQQAAKSKSSCRKPTDPDLLAMDNLAQRIQNEAKDGCFDSLVKEIEDFRQGAWDMRHFYVCLVGANAFESDRDIDWDTFIHSHDDNFQVQSALCLVRADYGIHQAWAARGSGWSSTVTPEGREQMREWLTRSEETLLQAATLDPQDPTPYAILQTVAMGLRGREKAEEWLAEALARDEFNYPALRNHQQILMKKWYGRSASESIAWANGIVDKAPERHPVRVLLIEALLTQSNDAAWPERLRLALTKEKWIKQKTLEIFRNVYQNNPDPPVKTVVERQRFRSLKRWMKRMVSTNALSPGILEQVDTFEQRKPDYEIV